MSNSRTTEPAPTLVIGAGNPIAGDDGTGIAALERLRQRWAFGADIDLLDGGTWGMNLLPWIESAGRLLILDAVNVGAAPGSPIALQREELPRFLSLKLSPHQIDLREVLALAELRATLPAELVVLGIQPERIEMSTDLSPAVAAALDGLVARAAGQLEAWGHRVRALPSIEWRDVTWSRPGPPPGFSSRA